MGEARNYGFKLVIRRGSNYGFVDIAIKPPDSSLRHAPMPTLFS
jgi:hypothetical protein